jgi:hypothetical protein
MYIKKKNNAIVKTIEIFCFVFAFSFLTSSTYWSTLEEKQLGDNRSIEKIIISGMPNVKMPTLKLI